MFERILSHTPRAAARLPHRTPRPHHLPVAFVDPIAADRAALGALERLVAAVEAHGPHPALLAFADADGALQAAIPELTQPDVALEGLLDKLKELTAKVAGALSKKTVEQHHALTATVKKQLHEWLELGYTEHHGFVASDLRDRSFATKEAWSIITAAMFDAVKHRTLKDLRTPHSDGVSDYIDTLASTMAEHEQLQKVPAVLEHLFSLPVTTVFSDHQQAVHRLLPPVNRLISTELWPAAQRSGAMASSLAQAGFTSVETVRRLIAVMDAIVIPTTTAQHLVNHITTGVAAIEAQLADPAQHVAAAAHLQCLHFDFRVGADLLQRFYDVPALVYHGFQHVAYMVENSHEFS